jgi:hypothetical protein
MMVLKVLKGAFKIVALKKLKFGKPIYFIMTEATFIALAQ